MDSSAIGTKSPYAHLISGSDLRGVATGGYGKDITLTKDHAASAAAAFVQLLQEQSGKKQLRIAIGHDPRLSYPVLLQGVLHGLGKHDCEVIDCGLCTTPAMFLTTQIGPKVDGAIMITASHLPPERNGLKFMTAQGGLSSAQIHELVDAMSPVLRENQPPVATLDFIDTYAKLLSDFIAQDQPQILHGMHIALDAGNGSGGFFEKVLSSLGAKVHGLHLTPDGHFPNHAPNPEAADALYTLSKAVVDHHCDLGVIFDADCDRAALVDSTGREINRNRLIALVARLILLEQPGATIVTDSVTSTGVADFIARHGGHHCRYKRGYKNIIDEAKRLTSQGILCPVAVETSGHCAFLDNYFLDDGAYLVAWLLRTIAKDLAAGKDPMAWIADLEEPREDFELRLPLLAKDFVAQGNAILEAIQSQVQDDPTLLLADDSMEGIRVHFPQNGWCMLRLSVHDPVMPLNIQSGIQGGSMVMARQLLTMLTPFANQIDLTTLSNFLQRKG